MTRRAILVLGMHRSGTSALTGVLVRLGAEAPTTLMQPNQHNPLGYWESEALCAFHERLLRAGGTAWDLWTRVNLTALDAEAGARFADEFRSLLQQEFGSAPLFVVKDPRICRFVPLWIRQLKADHIAHAPILMVRSPVEVARSLAARDGFSLEHALLLWLRHIHDAEFDTRAIRRSVVRYDALLRDWKTVTGQIADDVGLEWPGRSDVVEAEIAAFLRSDLRHHAIGLETLNVASLLRDWVTQTSAALDLLLCRDADRTAEAFTILDDVRTAFDRASAVFGPALDKDRGLAHQQMSSVEGELRDLRGHALGVERELDHARRDALNVETERDQLRHHVVHVETELDRARQHVAAVETDRDLLRHHVVHVKTELDRVRQHVADLETERAQFDQQRSHLELDLSQARQSFSAELTILSQRLQARDTRVQALERSLSWRWTAPGRAIVGAWLDVWSRLSQ
jgi:hypothetical protein